MLCALYCSVQVMCRSSTLMGKYIVLSNGVFAGAVYEYDRHVIMPKEQSPEEKINDSPTTLSEVAYKLNLVLPRYCL